MKYKALLAAIALLLLVPISSFAACTEVKKGDTWGAQARLKELGYFGVEPTGYFGKVTRAAVVAYQKDKGLEQVGTVGPKTRAFLNECKASAVLGTSTPAVGLTVYAGEQPTAGIAPADAQSVPFTNFVVEAGDADVHISKIVVERVGPSHNSAFYDVYLMSDLGSDTGYLNSEHRANIRTDYTVPAHSSTTISVLGDMNSDLTEHDGTRAAFRVVAIEADQTVTGLPVTGTYQTINASLVIGTAHTSVSSDDPLADRTWYVQDRGVRFAGIRVQAGSEDLTLNSITWRQNGSASASDILNVRTVINGQEYKAEQDERSYTSVFSPAISIPRGTNISLYVAGDIGTTGSDRTIKFDIDNGADIELYGVQYGFGIFPTPEGNTATDGSSVFITDTGDTDGVSGHPYYSASTEIISPGAFTGISR